MERLGSLLSVGANWSVVPFNGAALDQQLRVILIHDPPYTTVRQQPDGAYAYDGYLLDVWRIIARELRLHYSVIPLLKGGYGSVDENGTWTGMVGELVYRRADVALTWIGLRNDRAAVIDYLASVPVDYDQYTFYVRRGPGAVPAVTPGMFGALLKPLHADVWWLLLASLLVLSVALRASLRFSAARAESRRTVDEMTWGSCLLVSFMSVVGQGWASTPDSLAARTVTICSWMLGIIIYINYTANLISHLTVVTVDRPIGSLREFSAQSDWAFAMEPGIGVLNDWKVSRNPYERALYRRTAHMDAYIELDASGPSARLTLQPRVLTYIDINRIFYSQGAGACELVPLRDRLPAKSPSYMAIAQGREQMRNAINEVMQRMNQAGTMSRLRSQWLQLGQGMCDNSAGFKELSFGDLLAVLVVVPLAVISSICIFLAEVAWYKVRSLHQKRVESWVCSEYIVKGGANHQLVK